MTHANSVWADEALSAAVSARLSQLKEAGFARKLWAKDLSIWPGDRDVHAKIASRLGWLGSASSMQTHVAEVREFARELSADGFEDVALLGMGGSSLAPHVFAEVFGAASGFLRLHVMDTTDPDMIATFLDDVDLAKTLLLVASKSGGTIEPLSQMALFGEALADSGLDQPSRLAAITDPGTSLEEAAVRQGFRKVFTAPPDVGGRFAALTHFGILPAALLGVDIVEILDRGREMETACGPGVAEPDNPAVHLGALMAEAAHVGRDKLTLLASDQVSAFSLWIEQLVAESTGKQGGGIIPVVGEKPATPGSYGCDRVFVVLRLTADETLGHLARDLADAGHPVMEIVLRDSYDIGGEFVRWEVATATAGAIQGVNPFDEPNVTEAKDITKDILRDGGGLPEPDGRFDDARVFLSPAARARMAGSELANPRGALSAMAGMIEPGDYFGLLAFLPMDGRLEAPLERIRLAVREKLAVATCLEYGPRYLHSTGQAYKGGPNTGVFLMITRTPGVDQQVPGESFSMGELQLAQARGDFEALGRHGRRALWLHLASGDRTELAELAAALESGLA